MLSGNNLTLGLVLLGLILIAAIAFHALWVHRKGHGQAAAHDTGSQDALSQEVSSIAVGANSPSETLEVVSVPVSEQAAPLGKSSFGGTDQIPEALRHHIELSNRIDSIATIVCDKAFLGRDIKGFLPTSWRCGSKPFYLLGYNLASSRWEEIRADPLYSGFQAGVQLANRSGSLNEVEFSEFVVKTQTFSDHLRGRSSFGEMLEEVQRARALDQLAAQYDVQLYFVLLPADPRMLVAEVYEKARLAGFKRTPIEGRMFYPLAADDGLSIISLLIDPAANYHAAISPMDGVARIRLGLDVTQIPQSHNPYELLCQTSYQLGQLLGARLVDDSGMLLTDALLKQTGEDLQLLYAHLHAEGLDVGSPLARRLFS